MAESAGPACCWVRVCAKSACQHIKEENLDRKGAGGGASQIGLGGLEGGMGASDIVQAGMALGHLGRRG